MKKFFSLFISSLAIAILFAPQVSAASLIGMVNNGDIYVKAGANTNPWSYKLTSGMSASSLQMAGDRVAYIDGAGNLWLKRGLNSSWYLQTTNVTSFALTENRLLIIKADGDAYYKYGVAPTSSWDPNLIARNAKYVALSKSQMFVIFNSGELEGKLLASIDGLYAAGPDGGWELIATNAIAVSATDNRLIYIDTNHDVRGKDGPMWYPWWQNGAIIDTRTLSVALSGSMYCALYQNSTDNELMCKPYTFSDRAIYVFGGPSIQNFALSPQRIVLRGDNGDGQTNLYGIDYSGIKNNPTTGYSLVTSSGWKVLSTTGEEATTNDE